MEEAYRVLVLQAIELSGVKIYRFDSHLYFANADLFRAELNRRTGVDVVGEKAMRRRKMARRDLRNPSHSDASLAEVSALPVP